MAICPICKKPGEGDAEFCAIHGAKLIRESGSSASPEATVSSAGGNASSTDEPADTAAAKTGEVRGMRHEIARRDARIAELEAELAAAHRELNALRASSDASAVPPSVDEPTANEKAKPVKGDTGPRAESADSSLEETEYVSPPTRTYGWLIGVGGVVAGERYAIGPQRIDIGRMKKFADGGIRINDKSVSNPHAYITVENDTVMLHDEGSMNGTFLGDKETERITKVPLKNGDTVVVAERKVAEFVFKQK